jgi:DNA-binding response OmpR family regulator
MFRAMAPKTALVVEDDKGISNLLKDTLEAEGFQVLCEKDGDWGLKALERRLPDVLITDILLPSLGGFELLEALRRMPGGADVPVVAISGIYKGQRHKKQAQERLGVLAYFDKPFEIAALLFSIQEALGEDYPKCGATRASASVPRKRAGGADVFEDPLADFDQRMEQKDVERVESSFSTTRTAKGNLKHKRFAEVLAQLYRWRASGALLLRREKAKKIVYLKEGYPIFVKSNLLSECLGRVLVREKMISEEECERSLLLMKERPGRQQGTVLIEMGAISPHNLVFALQLQLEQKLFDLFAWPDGDFQFNAKIDIPAQTVHLDMSLATIVYEGVRRRVPERAVADYLEPFWDSYLMLHPDPAYRFQELSLEADERKLLALADGRRTARDIVDRCGLNPQHARQLLYTLIATETVQTLAKPQARGAFVDAPPSGTLTKPPPLKKKSELTGGNVFTSGRSFADELPVDEQRQRLVERARDEAPELLRDARGLKERGRR